MNPDSIDLFLESTRKKIETTIPFENNPTAKKALKIMNDFTERKIKLK